MTSRSCESYRACAFAMMGCLTQRSVKWLSEAMGSDLVLPHHLTLSVTETRRSPVWHSTLSSHSMARRDKYMQRFQQKRKSPAFSVRLILRNGAKCSSYQSDVMRLAESLRETAILKCGKIAGWLTRLRAPISFGHDRFSGPALWLTDRLISNGKLKSQNKVYKDRSEFGSFLPHTYFGKALLRFHLLTLVNYIS